MALTPAVSVQYANLSAVPPVLNDGRDHGKLRIAYGTLVYTGGGQGTAQKCRLPAGKLRIFPNLSTSRNLAVAIAASTLSIGLGAYVNGAGTPVAADVAAIVAATAVGAALVTVTGLAAPVEIESKGGVDVTITWAAANSPATLAQHTQIAYTLSG